MKTSNTYFVIQNVKKADNGDLRLIGQFIINSKTEIVSSPSSQPEDNEPKVTIEIPRMYAVKWILPPQSSLFYGAIKAFAEDMGYETVEHDDFSYPER
jgi:hypothetical protein